MWKPRNKWQLQTKGGCESSSSGGSGGSGIAILNFVTANPATGEVIFDEDNSSDPGAFYDAYQHRKPVMVFWDCDPFTESSIVFNALTKSVNVLEPG